jgi:hypothetical protein
MNYASRRMIELQMRLPAKWPTVPPCASKSLTHVVSAGRRVPQA